MSEITIPAEDRSERGRFMLLPEDPAATGAATDPRRPRIRRYRLARLDGEAPRGGSERRPPADLSYLRRSHD